jgi:hypothetical protein
MTAYEVGTILGRILASTGLVYIALLIILRFDIKTSFEKLQKPLSLVSITLVFILGLAGNVKAEGLIERAKRPFVVTDIPEAGLIVYVPERPLWGMQLEKKRHTTSVVLSTPSLYYPPASMEIALEKRYRVTEEEFSSIALSALNTVRKNAKISENVDSDKLIKTFYGDLVMYEDDFLIEEGGIRYSAKSAVGLMPSGRVVSIFLVTPEGQIGHILNMTHKIWRNLKEIRKDKIDVTFLNSHLNESIPGLG